MASSYDYDKVKRATRNDDIFCYDIVFIPAHLNNDHWALVVVNLIEMNVSFYDSYYKDDRTEIMEKVVDYLKHEFSEKKGHPFDAINFSFTLQHVENIPKQRNKIDCGVFICQYGEHLSRNASMNFNYKDMKYFRNRMIYEIVNQKILEPVQVTSTTQPSKESINNTGNEGTDTILVKEECNYNWDEDNPMITLQCSLCNFTIDCPRFSRMQEIMCDHYKLQHTDISINMNH